VEIRRKELWYVLEIKLIALFSASGVSSEWNCSVELNVPRGTLHAGLELVTSVI
jgi:hypothetical protein